MRSRRNRYGQVSSIPTGSVINFNHPLVKGMKHAFVFSSGSQGLIADLINPFVVGVRYQDSGGSRLGIGSGMGGFGAQVLPVVSGTTNFAGLNYTNPCFVKEGAKQMTFYSRITDQASYYNWDNTFNTDGLAYLSMATADDGFGGTSPTVAPWIIRRLQTNSGVGTWKMTVRTVGPTNNDLSFAPKGNGLLENIAMTYDGATQKVYSDGVLKDSASVSGLLTVSGGFGVNVTKWWTILSEGRNSSNGQRHAFYGICHYILLWDRPLSAGELQWLNVEPYAFLQGPTDTRVFLDQTTSPLFVTKSDSINNFLDTISLSNGAAANYGVRTGDQLSLQDAISLTGPPPDYFLLLGDSLANIQDSARVVLNIRKQFSDTVNNLVDAFATMVGIPVAVFDSQQFNWQDAVATGFGSPLSLTVSDTVNNYADFALAVLGNVRISVTVSDTINLLADAIRVRTLLRLVEGDNLSLSDSVKMRFSHLMHIAEALGITDSVKLDRTGRPAFSDSINNLNDSVSIALAVNLTLTKSDQLNLTDAVAISLDGVYNQPGFIDRIRRYLGDIQSS